MLPLGCRRPISARKAGIIDWRFSADENDGGVGGRLETKKQSGATAEERMATTKSKWSKSLGWLTISGAIRSPIAAPKICPNLERNVMIK